MRLVFVVLSGRHLGGPPLSEQVEGRDPTPWRTMQQLVAMATVLGEKGDTKTSSI